MVQLRTNHDAMSTEHAKPDVLGILSVICAFSSAFLLLSSSLFLIAVLLAAVGGFLGSLGVCKGRGLGIMGSVICLMILAAAAFYLFNIWDLQVRLNELLRPMEP
jgi:hypothetical protein